MSEDTLIQIRTDGEKLLSSLERYYYSNFTGLSKKAGVQGIFGSYEEFTDTGLFISINEKISSDTESGSVPRLMLLRSFLGDMYVLSRVSELTDKILTLESKLTLNLGEEKIPFRSSPVAILNETKKKKRDEIDASREIAQAELAQHYSERLYLTLAASEELGFSDYGELMEHIDRRGMAALTDEANKFLRDTEYVSKEMLEWFFMKHMELPLKDASHSDIAYLLNSFELKGGFPDKDYTISAARVLDDSGLVNSSDVKAESGKRAGKAQGSFLFLTLPPGEMAVSIYPAGGPEDYEGYLGSLGSALAFAFTEKDDDFEYRYLRNPDHTEIFSELFKNLVCEQKWLDRYIDCERGDDFYKLLYLRRLMRARLTAGRVIYERSLYSGEDRESLKALFKEIMDGALHAAVPEGDFLSEADIRKPMHSPADFKSLLLEPSLSNYLKERHDEEWWRVPEAGSELKNLWSVGGRVGLEDISGLTGFDGTADELRSVFERELG